MLFGKYQIVIFKEGRSGSRSLNIRVWFCLTAFLVIIALVAGNIWLAREWLKSRHAAQTLVTAERVMEDQRRQTIDLAERIAALSQDLERVQRFDSKLRLMMNMDKEPAEVGEGLGEFTQGYLPLHRQELAVRKMQEFIERLGSAAKLEEVRQQDLLRALRDNRTILGTKPSIWPVTGFISSSFGSRSSPFGGQTQFHKGLDISTRTGTPIVAPAEGKVIMAQPDGAYGNSVEIDHGEGLVTKYAHMQKTGVKVGDWVRRGDVIGYVGMTGRATGPHLHYEVRLNGVNVNPMRYILE